MDLLRQFAQGDLDAFETIFRQNQRDVYGWILHLVRDPGVAEDLTIETFWRIYRARARFDPEGNLGGWARRIATNVALDYLRQRRPEVQIPETLSQPAASDPVLAEEERQQIQLAFRQLPAKLQATATLALIEELPYQEIAEALGTSVGAVKLRVFRAVRFLRKRLGGLVHDKSRTNSRTPETGIPACRR
jgi:RNA polymerase sigma-70 factor (ECF subfamily)